jgi:hypothetical protein
MRRSCNIVDLPIRPPANVVVLQAAALIDAKSKDRLREAWVATVMREMNLKFERRRLNIELRRSSARGWR